MCVCICVCVYDVCKYGTTYVFIFSFPSLFYTLLTGYQYPPFWPNYILSFFLSVFLPFFLSFFPSFILFFILSFFPLIFHSFILFFFLSNFLSSFFSLHFFHQAIWAFLPLLLHFITTTTITIMTMTTIHHMVTWNQVQVHPF